MQKTKILLLYPTDEKTVIGITLFIFCLTIRFLLSVTSELGTELRARYIAVKRQK